MIWNQNLFKIFTYSKSFYFPPQCPHQCHLILLTIANDDADDDENVCSADGIGDYDDEGYYKTTMVNFLPAKPISALVRVASTLPHTYTHVDECMSSQPPSLKYMAQLTTTSSFVLRCCVGLPDLVPWRL